MSNTRRNLITIIVLTVIVRLVFCLVVYPAVFQQPLMQGRDPYDEIAKNLLRGSGYSIDPEGTPTIKRLPLYPILLYAVYATVGTEPWAVQLLQVTLAGLTAWLIFLIGRALFCDTVGLLAAALFSVHPHLLHYTARLYTETLYVFLICLFAYLLLSIPGAAPGRNGLISGGVFGLMLLTKGVAIWFPIFFFLGFLGLFLDPPHRRALAPLAKYLTFFAIGTLVTVSPWVYRNYVLTGKLVLTSTFEGGPLYQGLYMASNLGDGRTPGELDRAASAQRSRIVEERLGPIRGPIDEYKADRLAYSLWFKGILGNPYRAGRLFLRDLFLVWFLSRSMLVTYLSLFIHLPLLGLALYGIVWLARHDRMGLGRSWPMWSLIIYFNVIYAIAYPIVRFILPALPFTMILASVGLTTIVKRTEAFPERLR